jgi:hypothetical protein
MGIKHVRVSTVTDSASTVDVGPTEWNADHAITGPVILSSGTATNTPLQFVAGALNTSATVGAVEYDGTCFYNTAIDATRQVNCSMQMMVQTTSRTMSTATLLLQKMMNETTNGAVTVDPGTYFWEAGCAISAGTTISRNIGFGFGGTATLTRQVTIAQGRAAASYETPLQPTFVMAFAESTGLIALSSQPFRAVIMHGKVVVSASGTLIPSVSFPVGNSIAHVMDDAFFRIYPVGSSVTGFVGNWS